MFIFCKFEEYYRFTSKKILLIHHFLCNHIFCRSAKTVAQGVHKSLVDLINNSVDASPDFGHDYVKYLRKYGRYLVDVWN